MNGKLINVRLDERRMQMAQKLRAAGVPISELVREAIEGRYQQLTQDSRRRDLTAVLDKIHCELPDPPDAPQRGYNVHDRTEAKRAIRQKLKRKSQ